MTDTTNALALAERPSAPSIPLERADDGRLLARPQSMADLYRLAQGLAKSGLIRKELRGKPDDVNLIMLTALELGVPLMAGLRQISVINGRPYLEAQLMAAICLGRRDVCQYIKPVQVSEKGATWQTHRVGHEAPAEASFTLKDAERAGLINKETYRSHPEDMLSWRALGRLLKRIYPDLVGGVYMPGEAPTNEHQEVTPKEVVAEVLVAPTEYTGDLLDGIPDPHDIP